MRVISAGTLLARSRLRVTPAQPIRPEEHAIIVSPTKIRDVKIVPDGEAVILENMLDTRTDFVLIVVESAAHENLSRFYGFAKQLFAKKNTP